MVSLFSALLWHAGVSLMRLKAQRTFDFQVIL